MLGDLARRVARRAALLPSTVWTHAQALRLMRGAQAMGGSPLRRVASRLLAVPLLPKDVRPAAARVAARRAGRLVRRLGLLDSCLTRGLVVGVLLADREGVVLHVSAPDVSAGRVVRPGHAWVTLDGLNVTDHPSAGEAAPAAEILSLPLRRP